ncbi:MAG: HD domain-containing protein [Gammaproteobacteria bacterium]|nr:HD domain-containing protein [Gammaproteobacteria bacterium]
MPEHQDALEQLNKRLSLTEKLIAAHKSLNQIHPAIARIAVTLYDPETTVLKTYLNSSVDDNPLDHYQTLIDDAPSLKKLLDEGRPRVINNMLTFDDGNEHTKRIGRKGYAASYTLPMFSEGVFFGFIFFNATEQDVFTEHVLSQVDVYGHMISLMIINEFSAIKTLTAAIKTTGHITHCRDPETGSHLDRMSRYSLIIANAIADKYNLDDEYIEHVFMFSPLHDIGKIAIPDNVLLNPNKLKKSEMELMKTHSRKGREMIDDLIKNFGLQTIEHVNVLRNIAEYHHEAVNGTGYPDGKVRADIPLEARIVAVADVFDALTSCRSYKEAWSNEMAITKLKELAGEKLDKDCVEALLENMDEVVKIQKQFSENLYG